MFFILINSYYLPWPRYALGLGVCLLKDFLAVPSFLFPKVSILLEAVPALVAILILIS